VGGWRGSQQWLLRRQRCSSGTPRTSPPSSIQHYRRAYSRSTCPLPRQAAPARTGMTLVPIAMAKSERFNKSVALRFGVHVMRRSCGLIHRHWQMNKNGGVSGLDWQLQSLAGTPTFVYVGDVKITKSLWLLTTIQIKGIYENILIPIRGLMKIVSIQTKMSAGSLLRHSSRK
jgi:hypothetical protein